MKPIQGSIVVLVTPMHEDFGGGGILRPSVFIHN